MTRLQYVAPLQDQGNNALKKHKRFIPDAVKFYTQAIDQKVEDPMKNSVYYANRSHANLLLGKLGELITVPLVQE